MDGFYSQDQLSPQDLQHIQQQQQQQQHQQQQAQQISQQNAQNAQAHRQAQARASGLMGNMGDSNIMGGAGDNNGLGGGSIDSIMQKQQNELNRRRSMPNSFGGMNQDMNQRRMSGIGANDMMAFGAGGNGNYGNYQFNEPLSTGFPTLDTNNYGMGGNMGGFMGDGADYSTMSPDMMGNLIPSTFANLNMGQLHPNSPQMGVFPPGAGMLPPQYQSQMSMGNDFNISMNQDDTSVTATPNSNSTGVNVGNANEEDMSRQGFTPMDNGTSSSTPNLNLDTPMANYNNSNHNENNNSMAPPLSRHVSSSGSGISPQQATSSTTNITQTSSSDVTTPATANIPPGGQRATKEKSIYSKSGFDMLKALWLVATRKDPKINLGAVDLSCAFVVCDVTMNDCPIIYVSDNFQNLTGYSRHDIMGQNCRFLQAPDGKVEAGCRREFVDDGAVFNLKKMIHEGKEVQQSLINYRKGGKPFLNLLTMIPIPWDTDDIRYFIGFQIDLVECPDAIASGQELGAVQVNYKHSDIGQYIWSPPQVAHWEPETGQTLGVDDVSTLLQQFHPKGLVSDWHKQSWDKMLLENTDDVVHVLSLKGLFLYLSPSCRRILEYDSGDLVGNSLSSVCHPSDIVPVTRELKDATAGNQVNIVFRIRRKNSGYTWFESHGSLFVEQGKGRKCIILVGRKRPVFTLGRKSVESFGGIGDSELWTKLSTSGMFLFVSSNIRSLLDLQPENLIGTSIQELMRKETRLEFGRAIEKARRGRVVQAKHEVQNRRGQVLQAQTTLYPGDASEGQKPSFLLAQTKLVKASSRNVASSSRAESVGSSMARSEGFQTTGGQISQPAGGSIPPGTQDEALASEDNMFDELRTTKCSSWQFELRQMEKVNRILAEELGGLLSNKKKRKRRKGVGNVVRDCANCHTRNTPEWRRGPSGKRDLCNSCGLRWAKQTGRVSPRNSSRGGAGGNNGDTASKKSASPIHSSPLHKEMSAETPNPYADGANNSNGNNQQSGVKTSGIQRNGAPTQIDVNVSQAGSGAPSAVGAKGGGMPPPAQPTMSKGHSMASIREERETSQP